MVNTYLKVDDLRMDSDTPQLRAYRARLMEKSNFLDRGAGKSTDGEFTLQQEIWRLKERVHVLEIMMETHAKMDHDRLCALEKAAGIKSPE